MLIEFGYCYVSHLSVVHSWTTVYLHYIIHYLIKCLNKKMAEAVHMTTKCVTLCHPPEPISSMCLALMVEICAAGMFVRYHRGLIL